MSSPVMRHFLVIDTATTRGVFYVSVEAGRVEVVQHADDFNTVTSKLTPAEARLLASALVIQADAIEAKSKSTTEASS